MEDSVSVPERKKKNQILSLYVYGFMCLVFVVDFGFVFYC